MARPAACRPLPPLPRPRPSELETIPQSRAVSTLSARLRCLAKAVYLGTVNQTWIIDVSLETWSFESRSRGREMPLAGSDVTLVQVAETYSQGSQACTEYRSARQLLVDPRERVFSCSLVLGGAGGWVRLPRDLNPSRNEAIDADRLQRTFSRSWGWFRMNVPG